MHEGDMPIAGQAEPGEPSVPQIMTCQQWKNEQGFSLIEVTISLVVLGIGILTLSGMQSISLARNVDANQLTRVTNLASDMVDRIQFNRKNVVAYHGVDVSSGSGTCPATNVMANGDCQQWRQLLINSGLQAVRGTVTVNPTSTAPNFDALNLNRRTVSVQVTWTGSTNQNGATTVARPRVVTLTTVIAAE